MVWAPSHPRNTCCVFGCGFGASHYNNRGGLRAKPLQTHVVLCYQTCCGVDPIQQHIIVVVWLPSHHNKLSRIARTQQKKFVFDWNADEDTSHDINPIYAQRHDVQLFGRGHIAGIDIKEQKKKRSEFYENMLRARRTDEETDRVKYVNKTFFVFYLFNLKN